MTTKRKRGRPRRSPMEGASLREAAAQLGITRAALLKLIDRGLPAPLVRERRTVDIEAAKAWIAEHEDDAAEDVRTVLPLDPNDPRAQRDRASARLKAFKLAEQYDVMVPMDDVAAWHGDSLARLNTALKSVPAVIAHDLPAMTRGNAAAILAPAIEDTFRELDSERAFPDPVAGVKIEFPPDDDGTELFETFAPILRADDARASVAIMQATKYAAEADVLAARLIFRSDAVQVIREHTEMVRDRFRQVPDAVAALLAPGGNGRAYVLACINFELDRARVECGGESQGELVKPSPVSALDDEPLEYVGGFDEFESEDGFEDALA